jgi:predicted DNA-binding transcriptional regulator YafY
MEILSDGRFQMQPSFDPNNYFAHALGITVLGDGKPERIEFECDALLSKYLQTQPLHHSQHIREEGETHIVGLEVMPTFELLQWLQAHASEITVLQPKHIQDAVIHKLESALNRQQYS